MAIFHLSVKTISRSAGRSATAAAAYRAGVEITDERTGEIHDYRRKAGVESAELFLPACASEWATDRAKLWNAAEQSEKRKNSTVAREFEVALPSELSADQRRELAHEFARELVKRHGFAADVAIHAPGKDGDIKNHHAHILCTTRKLTAEGFTEKTRELDDRATGAAEVTHWREQWAGLTNAALERAGHAERIDHRTLEAQGIDRDAGLHLGPTATAIERRGEVSEKTQHHQERQQEAADKVAAMVAIAEATKAAEQAKAAKQAAERLTAATEAKEKEDDRIRKSALAAFAKSSAAIDRNVRAASGDLGRAVKGAERRVAERHYGRVVEAARREFKRADNLIRQAGRHIGTVGKSIAAAAQAVAEQIAARSELARQRAAEKSVGIDPRSAYHPDNIAKREAREAAAAAAKPAPRVRVLDRSKIERRPVEQVKPVAPPSPPKPTEQEAEVTLLEVSIGMRAQWDAALVAERALYLKELTTQAYAKTVAHVAEHQAHIDAKPMLFGRDKWEAQRQSFENRDTTNNHEWKTLKDGHYPFLERDKEAVQKAVERRVSDKNPELAQSMPKVDAVLQMERERVAAETHTQWLAERQREQEARQAREALRGKDRGISR